MSWSFEFVATSKTAAKQKVTAIQSSSSGHLPAEVASQIVYLIDRLGELPGHAAIKVRSNGHLPSDSERPNSTGSATIEVSNLYLVDETNATS